VLAGNGGDASSPAAAAVPHLWSLAVALVALTVYLVQSPPVSGDKDSAEFTLVLALNGVAHPTGYPLFTLFGHLFVRLVHGLGATWAYAANAWAALGGGVAIYFLHRLSLSFVPASARLDRPGRFLLGLLPVALFAFNPIWTYETTLAEVYSWHVGWVLGASLYFVRLVRALADEETWPARRLHGNAALWGLLCGVGGAHHATSIFVAAPLSIAIFVVLIRRRLGAELVTTALAATALAATVLVATCVPLLSYAIILWRSTHPAPIQWWALLPGFQGLLTHMTGAQYRMILGHFAPSADQRGFLLWYVYPFLFPGLLLAVVNAVRARGLGERTLQLTFAASALLATGYAFSYGVPDPSSYFLYPMALGAAALTHFLGALARGAAAARRAVLVVGTLLGITSLVLWVPWLRTGQQRTDLFVSFDRLVHGMWSSIPADSGFVFWTNDMYHKLREYQALAGEKPGIEIEHALLLHRPEARQRFLTQNGFDPVMGLELDERALRGAGPGDRCVREAIDSVEFRVNAMTRLPVIHFDPQVPTVRLLLKPGADTRAAPRPQAQRSRGSTLGAGRSGR
jgi:hypothetical protein